MQESNEGQEVEALFDVPVSWSWCQVKDVVQTVFDGPFGSHLKTSDYTSSGVRVIRLENLAYLGFKHDKTTYISHEKYEGLKQHTIYQGDVIVGSFIADGVKAALIPHLEDTAIAKADCFCVRYNPEAIDNKYLYYGLSTGYISEGYQKIMRGVTRSRINTTQLKQTFIPLAPLPEQRRIVAKLEELFSKLDAGVEALRATQKLLKRYRQSVLHAAVTGELTRAWREAHPEAAETGEALLARIRQQRRAQWEEATLAKLRESGKEPKGEAWKQKYQEPEAPDTAELPELPLGWVWSTGDTLFNYVTSGSRGWAEYYSTEGALFIRIGNLSHTTTDIDFADVQKVKLPSKAEGLRSLVAPGDLLVSITADVGMIGLAPEGIEEAYINQHVALARPVNETTSPYVAWYLLSEGGGQKQFQELRRGAVKAGLGLDDIRAVRIPIPPTGEQLQIISEIERRFSILNDLEQTLTAELTRAERLRQSILHRAFTGQLVPQDPTDEPAAELLARLRAVQLETAPKKAQAGKPGRKPKAQPEPAAAPVAEVPAPAAEPLGAGVQASFGF
ncbi:restriction endonuclease subunit S [Hymenobacter edaphi]|uniref:Type I restriction modification DNA specificity domain-containing protein n=1 Tax=Hymenobacter edaphi TaxID=2211146 RepID=A0A328BQ03_9BACT|nr:restriction endonuclease subunit S [Hymenobacter edaphi]RAK68086.1 hypothetical protein DLM85_08585 [Hymenobacter edaphi]